MIIGMIAFGGLGFVLGMAYGYALGYNKGLKKLPDDLTAIIKAKADKLTKDAMQKLKDEL